MSDRDPMVRLLHMRDYAAKIATLIARKNRADLEQDEVLCLAVTRLIELIGEAASQYPKELQMQYPQIPWAKMISMRNRLIHGYDFVDYNILWNAVTMNIPRLLVGERYFDQATGHSVAVMEVDLYGKRREVMVAYVIEEGCARMLTVHPLKGNEKENRVRSGRWRKV